MADTGDKTEKASGQKLRQARQQGQSVRSKDLATAIGILVSFKLVVFLMPAYLEDFRSLFAMGFAPLDGDGTLDNAWSTTFSTAMGLLVKMLLPLFVVPFASIVGSFIPGGWVFSTKSLMPDLGRFNPITNLGRLFSPKHLFELGVSMLKAGVLIALLLHLSRASAAGYLELQSLSIDKALLRGADMMFDGILALSSVFLVFAAVDVPAQVFFFLRGQRMSKQDQKEEHKSSEGSPQIRQRIRALQRQIAKRSVKKTVPTADVVIVNPEHYAVALKYDEKRAGAPFVIAKGIDEIALYIREVAIEHGIEVLPLPPLARAIYFTSQVQQQIPMPLYNAVAQVLTYVMQLKAFRGGRRNSEPLLPSGLAIPTHLSEPQTAPAPTPA